MEKIKINISQSLYTILEQDINLFEFHKKDGSLNRNDFYNQLIVHYYQTYHEKQTLLFNQISNILDEQTSCSKSQKQDAVFSILQKVQMNSITQNNEKMDKTINLKPTRYSENLIEMIQDNCYGQSLSAYFRNMFAEYASLPRNQREKIIYQPLIEKISCALEHNCKISIKTKTENTKSHIVSPYKMTHSKEEFYNYLLCSEAKRCLTFRLTRIKDLMIVNEPVSFSEEQKQIFLKMMEHGPQFLYSSNIETIVVRLTDQGKKMYKSMYVQRPVPYKIEDDLYYFDCSGAQIMHYFKRFGTSAVILSPTHIIEKMTEFHELASRRYRKQLNRNRLEEQKKGDPS
ncbi:MAG: WYL domain-containing protein [Erysipelotrichaceae bacterium]|nr:WYL domain-containing protein [Erysipelotrichaceae bacterium]